jgi:hypothetical protein
MANQVYSNFFLSNTVEDQFNSHLDLQQFCTVDNTLEGVDGMKRVIHSYRATNGTERLTVGQGNSRSIEVSYTPVEYIIALAQNRFDWYDEHAMTDPMLVPVGMKHAGTDMFNTVQADIYAEFAKTGLEVPAAAFDYDAFVDASAALNLENIEGVTLFGIVHPKDKAKIRKALKDQLQYVEAYARQGYIGSVAGINLYDKADATEGEIIVATKEAVTIFNKKGVEVEIPPRSAEEANLRKNTAFSRKYYVVALTDESKAVKIKLNA